MKSLIIIPARGGSKGIPDKNIKLLADKPLIQYTIDAAREIFSDDIICVSTDSEKIKNLVEEIGLKVPFLRPEELATDTAGTHEVLLHAISYYEKIGYFPDTLILLQPTSPLRNAMHIRNALKIYNSECEMVVSVKETKANPYYLLKEENSEGWLENSKKGNFIRRQDCPKVYELNGAVYIINVNSLKKNSLTSFTKVRKYVMDEYSSIDIDNMMDFCLAELFLKNKENNI